MNRIVIMAIAASVAAVPAGIGLVGNQSFARSIPVRHSTTIGPTQTATHGPTSSPSRTRDDDRRDDHGRDDHGRDDHGRDDRPGEHHSSGSSTSGGHHSSGSSTSGGHHGGDDGGHHGGDDGGHHGGDDGGSGSGSGHGGGGRGRG
jgi:hypothetical protein